MLSFQKLDVYRASIEFLKVAHEIIRHLPRGNADLIDQLKRASQSIPQNIGEGSGRSTKADQSRHYAIARGSAMECAAHLDVMSAMELITLDRYERGVGLLVRIVGMLTRMM